ncbi:AfsR/SARP family transcriptional regulator [Streptomyces hoynatensis]|nr:AfsR/SARP family transcriptional regulator [Streptomyces hoynatensis]
MRFSVLGPLEITEGSKAVDVVGLRQQHILATLLLNAGHTVSIGRLTEATWDSAPPATAKEQVQNCLSMLRRALTAAGGPPGLIVKRPSGYLLDVRDRDLDLKCFQDRVTAARQAAAQGKTEQAGRGLRTALAMWRGPALENLTSRLVRAGAARLNEQRQTVLEECISLELALGRHRELVGELSALITEYPLREELAALLMLALYRSGRQAEALDVYRRTRRAMIEDLGLEPGLPLRQVEQSILTGDADLGVPAEAVGLLDPPEAPRRTIPRQLPPPRGDLVGVEEAMCRVPEQREPTARPLPEAYLFTGGIGVGKTTLAVQLAHRLKERYRDGQLFADLRGSRAEPTPLGAVVAMFLQAMGIPVPDRVDERIAEYRSALAERQMLVVLDDVPREDVLRELMPPTPGSALIATSRARVFGKDLGHTVQLGTLGDRAALDLLAATVGDGRVERNIPGAMRVAALCGNLPIALRGAAIRLAGKPHWSVDQFAELLDSDERRFAELERGGPRIRALFEVPYGRLSAQARLVFRGMSEPDSCPVTAAQAAALLGLPLDLAEEALEEAVDARLIEAARFPGGEVAYWLAELQRVFARQCAAEAGGGDAGAARLSPVPSLSAKYLAG